MKIDILQKPPADIFRNRRNQTIAFIISLTLSGIGILLGVYAIFFDTAYYEKLETLALIFFAGPATLVAFFGEKLQRYKKLLPPQQKRLADLRQEHPEIENYCALVEKASRQLTLSEFEACEAWAEETRLKDQKEAE